ncbi:MAG: peptidyl-tRNA hydrolase [Candidatus Diapherotrites archaeon]|nr:peptidyl-tRNA hydrolase [Candidatus Diapherotrites archaeon]
MHYAHKQVIILRADLKMGKGKTAAQCAHAAVQAFLNTQAKKPEWTSAWLNQGMPKIVVKVSSEKELLELFEKAKKKIPCALIKDAGHTQIEPGTLTCLGMGPAPENELDTFTRHLKLV